MAAISDSPKIPQVKSEVLPEPELPVHSQLDLMLIENPRDADIPFWVEAQFACGRTQKAHGIILALASPVLREILTTHEAGSCCALPVSCRLDNLKLVRTFGCPAAQSALQAEGQSSCPP